MTTKRTHRALLVLALGATALAPARAQSGINPNSTQGKMQWFADAKLGIFVHWGIYAVNGFDEKQSLPNHKISHAA